MKQEERPFHLGALRRIALKRLDPKVAFLPATTLLLTYELCLCAKIRLSAASNRNILIALSNSFQFVP